MKRLWFCVLVFFFTAWGGPVTAQIKEQQAEYERIIGLSTKIKAIEKEYLGVDPGSFATKAPAANPPTVYRLTVQNKLRLASGYLATYHLEDFETKPDEKLLAKKYPHKDLTFFSVNILNQDVVNSDLLSGSKTDLIITIAHEDFHNYRKVKRTPRRIDESFAKAFSHFEAREILATYLPPETVSRTEIESAINTEEKYALSIRSCYDALDLLYHSRLTVKQKLKKREAIFEICGTLTDSDFNNAYLSFQMTYAAYYFYAMEQLRRYGAKQFVAAYVGVSNGIKSEKAWLREFENLLKQPDLVNAKIAASERR